MSKVFQYLKLSHLLLNRATICLNWMWLYVTLQPPIFCIVLLVFFFYMLTFIWLSLCSKLCRLVCQGLDGTSQELIDQLAVTAKGYRRL